MYEEMLIGFDAREMWLETDQINTAHEDWREKFLLRREIEKVLSADTLVWPSVFDLDKKLELPDWRGLIQDLWDDLQRMEHYLAKGWGAQWRPCSIIAVTKLVDSEWKQEMRAAGYPVKPPELDKSWSLLGYDVSDEFLLSGLSDCGYTPEDVRTLGKRWSPHLNDHHLLADWKQAVEFQKMTDERVVEHAPFYVYGLYLIRRAGKAQVESSV
jgi:hypothetical protein